MQRRNLPDKACSKFDEDFWINSRKLSDEESVEIVEEHLIQSWRGSLFEKLRVRTQAETWHPPYSVLLPGETVRGSETRDADVAVDTQFHKRWQHSFTEQESNRAPLVARQKKILAAASSKSFVAAKLRRLSITVSSGKVSTRPRPVPSS